MSLEIGIRNFQAKERIVGKLVRAYIITRESDGSVKFDEFFFDMTKPFRSEDFLTRLRGCMP